jgi:hypothetical protein
MKKLHPAQELATKISIMLIEADVPIRVALAALSVTLVCACKEEGMTKAEILNKVGNTIDTVEGKENESGYW